MNRLKMISGVLACAALVSALGGCGKGNTSVGGSEKYDKKLTYTMSVNHSDAQIAESASFDYIKEKFNVDFEFYYVAESGAAEKARIWMATGDMPDILQTSIGTNYNTFLSWVEQGLIRELPDLSKWENLQKQQEYISGNEYFEIDGKRYAWLSSGKYAEGEPAVNPAPYGFFYRTDIAKEVGLYKENDEYKWDEFVELARAMRDKYKDTTGFIPWGMDKGLYPYGTGLMMYSPYWEQYKLNEDGTYSWAFDLPETWEAIEFANKMFKEGVFVGEQPIFNGKEASDKFKTGQCGILMQNAAIYNIRDIFMQFEATQGKKAEDCISIAKVYAPDGKMWGQYGMGFGSVTVFRPDLSDEKLERIMDIFDWLLTDEGTQMACWGVEGKDYNVVNGEKVLVNDDYTINGANPFLAKAMVASFTTPLEIQYKLSGERVVNMYEDYTDFLVKHDENFRKYDYRQLFFGGKEYREHGAYFYDGADLIKRLMPSEKSIDEIKKEYETWKNSVRPNVELVLAELNAAK